MDKSKIAVALFDKQANTYQDKFMDVSLYSDSFDLFCDSILKNNAAVLELACGPGNITRYLSEKRPDLKILGTDLSPNMIALAKNNNPQAEFQLMDCRDIGTLNQKYDGIMCGFCLPYLSQDEAIQLIGNASGILNEDGVLYISTMEESYQNKSGIRTSSSGDEIYVNYHRADYLTDALEDRGFRIISLQRQDFPATDGTKVIDLVIVAAKVTRRKLGVLEGKINFGTDFKITDEEFLGS